MTSKRENLAPPWQVSVHSSIPRGKKCSSSLTNDSHSSYALPLILLMYDFDCAASKCRESNRHFLPVAIFSGDISIDQEVT